MWMKPVTFGFHTPSRAPADPTTEPSPSHTLMLADAQRAEQLGFDTVWIPDHYYFQRAWGLEPFPEAWTLMTAIIRGRTGEPSAVSSLIHWSLKLYGLEPL